MKVNTTEREPVLTTHEYGVVEESGIWHVTIDDEPERSHFYPSEKIAREIAAKLAAAEARWRSIFELETRVAEAFKDRPWPYGATCVNNGTDNDPEWTVTEPYRADDESVRTVTPDPTGYVQIGVYTRDLYEEACKIIDVEPATDAHISEHFEIHGHGYIPDGSEPSDAVMIRLSYRRHLGIQVECVVERNTRADRLEESGLLLEAFTRDQYEQACKIMGVPVLTDRQVMIVVTMNIANEMGVGVRAAGLPNDDISTSLAYRRSIGMTMDPDEAEDEGENTGDTTPEATA